MANQQTGSSSIQARLGRFEVTHRIKKGESISRIVQNYRKQGWKVPGMQAATDAVWRLNTRVYGNLRDRDNPDLIYPNDVLVIPRTRDGYEDLIRRLIALFNEVKNDTSAKRELDRIQKQADKYGQKVDFAATVLTLFVSVGFKVGGLVKAQAAASKASGTLLQEAIKKQERLAIDITVDFGTFVEGQLVDALGASETAKLGNTGVTQTLPKAIDVAKYAREAKKWAIKGPMLLAHAAGILLDYTSPSKIARWYTGFDETLRRQKQATTRMKTKTLKLLADKVIKVREEKRIVWGS